MGPVSYAVKSTVFKPLVGGFFPRNFYVSNCGLLQYYGDEFRNKETVEK